MDCRILSVLMVKKPTSGVLDDTRMLACSAAGDYPYPLRTAWPGIQPPEWIAQLPVSF
jgi:hypothetical protein